MGNNWTKEDGDFQPIEGQRSNHQKYQREGVDPAGVQVNQGTGDRRDYRSPGVGGAPGDYRGPGGGPGRPPPGRRLCPVPLQ